MLWKEQYRIGVPLIDEQHKELFNRIENYVQVLRSNDCWENKIEIVNKTLDFMKDYVITHFTAEEAYQRKIGYPKYNEHKKIHDNMVEYVNSVSRQYEQEGYKEQLMQQLAGKLLAWLVNHVAAEDQRIADFAEGRDAAND
ncbi:MAG TPA: hemerythrin family protein [Clostridiales bacterium]|nr:hemerythrin family protein [Clostridiales bacterium]